MNNNTKFFTDIKNLFNNTNKLNKKEIIEHNFFPNNLKTKAKLNFLEAMPDEITEAQFVELLQYQTVGADYVNIDYLLDYYKTECDDNMMPIFTQDFHYKSLKPQALYTYVIIKNLQTHPVFKNYPELLKFKFEQRMEEELFTGNNNFKYDLDFEDRDIAIEIDEDHHKRNKKGKNTQHKIDDQKDALVKILGKTLFRISTFKVVDLDTVKKNIYNTMHLNKTYNEEVIQTILEKILNDYTNPEHVWLQKNKELTKTMIVIALRKYAKLNKTVYDKTIYKIIEEQQKDKHKDIFERIYNVVKQYMTSIESTYIILKNSSYLCDKLNELFVLFFHSLLTDFKFRQDYIFMIFKEDILDSLANKLNNIQFITESKNEKINNKHVINGQIANFTSLNDTIEKIVNSESEEFEKLLKIKAKCLENSENPYVISVDEIIDLLSLTDENTINRLQDCVLKSADKINISSANDVILLSWDDINDILTSFSGFTSYADMLLLYYVKIDKIYESINKKIFIHNNRIISRKIDYDVYVERIKNKCSGKSLQAKNNNIDYCTNKSYKDSDYERLIRPDITYRYKQIYSKFETIVAANKSETIIKVENSEDYESDIE